MNENIPLRPLADGEAYICEADPSLFNTAAMFDEDGMPRPLDLTPNTMIVVPGKIRIATIVDGKIVSVE